MSYQLIVYGASGFTGQRTVEYLIDHAPDTLRWAIAGRNRDKLDALKERLQLDVDVVVADAKDATAIDQLVQQTEVLLTTAGPYALYGSNLVQSCAQHGVHYVDITGEVPWVQDMIAQHGATAAESGAKIIPCCGFDSVPADLGTWMAQQYAREQGLGELVEVRGYYTVAGGGLNGGTLLSLLNILEQGDSSRLANPKALLDDLSYRDFVEGDYSQWREHYANEVERWAYPFFMEPINSKVVYRSIGLAEREGLPHPRRFSYREFHAISRRRLPAAVGAFGWAGFSAATMLKPTRQLLRRFGPSAGDGPSQEAMDKGYFKIQVIGTTAKGQQVVASLSYPGDAGNKATTCFLSECALALCLDQERLPKRAGFLTPSMAFEQVLVDRLQAVGATIAQERLG